jgi:hypothetical protein
MKTNSLFRRFAAMCVASGILPDVEPGFQPGGRIARTRNPDSEMEREDGGVPGSTSLWRVVFGVAPKTSSHKLYRGKKD